MSFGRAIQKTALIAAIFAVFWMACSKFAFASPLKARGSIDIENQISDIVGIEYLFAAPNSGPIYTRWGHALLRLVNPKIAPEKNLVISFAADVADRQISYVKGVLGDYKIVLDVKTLEEAGFEYNQTANQNIDRYILALRPSDLRQFLNRVIDWLNFPEKMGNYTFLSNNCAGALSRLFSEAGLPVELTRNPSQLSEEFRKSGISPFPPLRMSSAALSWSPVMTALGMSPQEFATTRSLSSEQIQTVLERTGLVTLARILYRNPIIDQETKARLRTALAPYFDQISFQDLIDIRSVPPVFFRVPESADQIDLINRARRKFFGKSALKSDLEFLAAMSFEWNPTEYHRLEMRRIQADEDFASVELASDLKEITPLSGLRIATNGAEVSLRYISQSSGNKSTTRASHSKGISGKISADWAKVRFDILSCSLADPPTGLGDDCALISVISSEGRSVRVVGFGRIR